jgi:hypothetical protein
MPTPPKKHIAQQANEGLAESGKAVIGSIERDSNAYLGQIERTLTS